MPITISASTRNARASADGDVLGPCERVEHPLEVVLPREPGGECRQRHERHDHASAPPAPHPAPQQRGRGKDHGQRERREHRRDPLQRERPRDAARRLGTEGMDRECRDCDGDNRRTRGGDQHGPEDATHPAIVQGLGLEAARLGLRRDRRRSLSSPACRQNCSHPLTRALHECGAAARSPGRSALRPLSSASAASGSRLPSRASRGSNAGRSGTSAGHRCP